MALEYGRQSLRVRSLDAEYDARLTPRLLE